MLRVRHCWAGSKIQDPVLQTLYGTSTESSKSPSAWEAHRLRSPDCYIINTSELGTELAMLPPLDPSCRVRSRADLPTFIVSDKYIQNQGIKK